MTDPTGGPAPSAPEGAAADDAGVDELVLDDAQAASGDAAASGPARSAWADVWLSPLRGGAPLGLVLVGLCAAGTSWLEGGVGDVTGALLLRGVLCLAAVPLLGIYARRIVLCTIEGDRPVPWFGDARDQVRWPLAAGAFAAICVTGILPALVLTVLAEALSLPAPVTWILLAVGVAAAAAHLPFAVTSSALRGGAMGAFYGTTRRAWRADPQAAKVALRPTVACLGLLALSVLLARWLVPHWEDAKPAMDHTGFRDPARGIVFLVRFAAVWAAFASFRVSGLLARDVPAIREVLA